MTAEIITACTDWGMVAAIIGTNVGFASVCLAVTLWAFNKLDSDIKSVASKVDADTRAHSARMDQMFESFNARTDRLYQMFIDLLKSQNPKTDP